MRRCGNDVRNSHVRITGPILRRAAAVLILAASCQASWAASPDISSSSREVREAAIQSIPFQKLTQESQTRLRNVVSNPTIHRRLPAQKIDCNPDLYLFLLRNPEVVVGMWQVMGITNITLNRTGPFTFDTRDGVGINSNLELVYGTPDIHVLYGEGEYEGSLLKRKTTGRCVMVLKSDYSKNAEQRTLVGNQLDVFLQLDNVGVELVAKTLQPLLGKTADHNFAETATFVSRVSQALERSPNGVDRLASRLKNVDPPVRQQFIRVANRVYKDASARELAADPNNPIGDLESSIEISRAPADSPR